MTPKHALDVIVSGLAELDARLSGDDSPLANPWEEIKEQLQHGESVYWPVYVDTARQFVSGVVADLRADDLAALSASLKGSSREAVERKLLQRLWARGKKEKIRYAPLDFEYFCYPLLDFTVYGQVVERTGLDECYARVFSGAAPTGEYGTVNCSMIDRILLPEEFEAARAREWPDTWSDDGKSVDP